MKKLSFLFATLLFAIVASVSAIAQPEPGQGCACPTNAPLQIRNIVICLNGANINVDVTFCTALYPQPVNDFPCNVPPRTINAWTRIAKVCPKQGGIFPPATDAQILQAVLCAISPAGGNQLGYGAFVPAAGTWNWTVVYPKCTTRDVDGCVVWCDENICCTARADFKRDPGTGLVVISATYPNCPTNVCPTACNDNGCQLRFQPCPTCP